MEGHVEGDQKLKGGTGAGSMEDTISTDNIVIVWQDELSCRGKKLNYKN